MPSQTNTDRPNLPAIFVRWYLLEAPNAIVVGTLAYMHAVAEIFAFVFLIKTLFAPWKAIRDAYPHRGFDFEAIAETFTLNCFTRFVGFIFRITALFFGLALEIFVFTTGMAIIAVWALFPLLAIIALRLAVS